MPTPSPTPRPIVVPCEVGLVFAACVTAAEAAGVVLVDAGELVIVEADVEDVVELERAVDDVAVVVEDREGGTSATLVVILK